MFALNFQSLRWRIDLWRTPSKSGIVNDSLVKTCSQSSLSVNLAINGQKQSPKLSEMLSPFASSPSLCRSDSNKSFLSAKDWPLESTPISKSKTRKDSESTQEVKDISIEDVVKRMNKAKPRNAVVLGNSHLLIPLSVVNDFSIETMDTSTQTLIETKDQMIEVCLEAEGLAIEANTQTDFTDLRVDRFTQTDRKRKLKLRCILM